MDGEIRVTRKNRIEEDKEGKGRKGHLQSVKWGQTADVAIHWGDTSLLNLLVG